jgi:hypothetical protein
MPFVYSSTLTPTAGVDNTSAISLPPINRYTYPWGFDVSGVTGTGSQNRHIPSKMIQFVPIKFEANLTIDRIGMMFVAANSTVDTWTYDLGLYSHNATDNYPSDLITNFGTLTYQPGVTANGPQEITINQSLSGNIIYWIAIGINASAGTDIAAGRTPWVFNLQGDFQMYRKRGIFSQSVGSMGACWGHSVGTYAGTLPASVSYASNTASFPTFIRTAIRRSA